MFSRFAGASMILLTGLSVHVGLAGGEVALRGTWKVLAYDRDGQAPPEEIIDKLRVVIDGDKLIIKPKLVAQVVRMAGKKDVTYSLDEASYDEVKFKLDRDKGWIDLFPGGNAATIKGLFVRDKDNLRICFPQTDKKRPKKMPEQPKAGMVRMVLTLEAKKR
jgi:uncharacterized protein (TIGR03067 family)